MQLGSEVVRQALVLACRHNHIVRRSGQVAYVAVRGQVPQGATDHLHTDRLCLGVDDGQDGLCCMAVNELDAEDLRIGECGLDGHAELGALVGSDGFFIDLMLRSACLSELNVCAISNPVAYEPTYRLDVDTEVPSYQHGV